MLADDHPFIPLTARLHKKGAALLQVEKAVAVCLSAAVGDHHAAQAPRHFPFPGSKGFENGGENAKTRCAGEKVISVAHKTSRRDEKLHRRQAVLGGL